MRALRMAAVAAAVMLAACCALAQEEDIKITKLEVVSSAFKDGEKIPARFTCDGENISPEISWSGAPDTTKSFIIIADDPDAPMGTWTHWVVYNIPVRITRIEEGLKRFEVMADGTNQGTNDFRKIGYDGPCPPIAEHRYFFKVYAVNGYVRLAPGCTKADIEDAIKGHILAYGELMGRYKR